MLACYTCSFFSRVISLLSGASACFGSPCPSGSYGHSGKSALQLQFQTKTYGCSGTHTFLDSMCIPSETPTGAPSLTPTTTLLFAVFRPCCANRSLRHRCHGRSTGNAFGRAAPHFCLSHHDKWWLGVQATRLDETGDDPACVR